MLKELAGLNFATGDGAFSFFDPHTGEMVSYLWTDGTVGRKLRLTKLGEPLAK
jgi:hypothetical protein